MIKPTFTEATSAAEALNLTRPGLLQAAREGKLVAWVQPETSPQRPFIVRAGKLQPTADGTGRKLAMPDGQFLVFERDAMVNLKGNAWLDLSLLTQQNHALLLFAYRGHDGEPVGLIPEMVLGDGAGNFYEVASEGPRTMALIGFMTKDLDALRTARVAAPDAKSAQSTPKVLKAPKVHTTKDTRRDILAPVIEHAKSLCKNQWDVAEVWCQLHKLAGVQYLVLLHVEGKSIAYTDGDETKFLKRKDLAGRIRRQKEKTAL